MALERTATGERAERALTDGDEDDEDREGAQHRHDAGGQRRDHASQRGELAEDPDHLRTGGPIRSRPRTRLPFRRGG